MPLALHRMPGRWGGSARWTNQVNGNQSSQKCSAQSWCRPGEPCARIPRDSSRRIVSISQVLISGDAGVGSVAHCAWVSAPSMGHGSFLPPPDASNLARASGGSDHIRSLQVFEKPFVSWRKCILFLRGSSAIGIADRAGHDSTSPAVGEYDDAARREAVGAEIRRTISRI